MDGVVASKFIVRHAFILTRILVFVETLPKHLLQGLEPWFSLPFLSFIIKFLLTLRGLSVFLNDALVLRQIVIAKLRVVLSFIVLLGCLHNCLLFFRVLSLSVLAVEIAFIGRAVSFNL
jgi:hypothetical protein